MSENILVGLAALGIPLLAAAFLMLRRHAAVFRMVVAMILLGLGYLTATGAISDIGATLLGQSTVPTVIETPVTAPAAETTPAPAVTPEPAPSPAAAPPDPAATVPDEPPPAPEDAAPSGAPIDSPAEAPASGEEIQPTETPPPAPVTP